MSTPPILTFAPKIDPEAPPWLRQHLTLIYQKLGNHTQAMSLLAQKSGGTTNNTTIIEGGSSNSPVPPTPSASAIGSVNNQSAVTSYATQAGDNGALIVLSDASTIAVNLTMQSPPWFCWIANQGSGGAILTPASGTISYAGNAGAASMPLLGGYGCIVAFDGTDWWAATQPIVPVSTAEVAHQWLDSYNASTGAFTQSQPAIADISELSTALALLAPLASPALTGTPTTPTAAPGTDNTQIASTAYADAAVAVETSRAEAAEALLAPKASPTFTGAVTQPDTTVLTAPTTATSATAGTASALPAMPAGYLQISLGGTIYKIPYFSA